MFKTLSRLINSKRSITTLMLLMLSLSISAKDEQPYRSILGSWQGKWDGIYHVKIEVVAIEKDKLQVNYSWQEKVGGAFNQVTYPAEVFNLNTIDFHKVSLRVDPADLNKLLAYGKFDQLTRIALLSRVEKD
ncbi:hypothetical protein [Aliikangiella maris]|uniref:Uncharacterized protein n=2 Tax=Aliikangiella maris TaxID=3162458 RepID=A0ABV2BZC5_9GAMM